MIGDLPEYYFRIKDNGAVVFKVGTDNRQRRIEMDEIATINLRNGNIKPHGEYCLTEAERDLIQSWIADRTETLARRDVDDIRRTIDQMNLTAHWLQTRATDAQIDDLGEALLMAIFDLRSTLVRKQAERVIRATDPRSNTSDTPGSAKPDPAG